jgi:DNA-binding winged helix-turn-helix (wHTH) protein/tetratricopeptide (TPR) repeat protein
MHDPESPDRVDLSREPDFTIGELLVSPSMCRVRAAGKEERVEPQVMAVIVALARAQGRTVSRDRLVEACWEGRIVTDDAVNRVVAKARKLARCIDPPAFSIETTTKVGFRLTPIPAVRPREEQRISVAAAVRQWCARLGRRGRGLVAAGVVILVGALALAATLFGWPAALDHKGGLVEVAVFEPQRTEDPDLQRLSTALNPTLVRLFRESGVDVMLRPTNADNTSGAADAAFRVAGTLRRTAEALVIDAQIVDRRSGLVLWSAQFDRPAEQAAGWENEAAPVISGALICTLNETRSARGRLTAEVLSLLLTACDAGTRFEPERRLRTTLQLVEAAPDLAAAHAMRATALVGAAYETRREPDEAALMIDEARAAARRALHLDRRNARAYTALASSYEGGWSEIERNLQRALEIDPWLLSARATYSGLLRDVGRTNAAIEWNNRTSRAADQYSRLHLVFLAQIHASLGNRREAEAAIERLRTLEPGGAFLRGLEWTITIWWEDLGVARSRLRALGQRTGQSERDIACMDLYLSRLDRQPTGARGLPSECSDLSWEWRIRMLARQGDVDGAYALYETGGAPIPKRTRILFYPEMRAFRRDPRFFPLAKQLGLVDYWISTDKWPDSCAEPDLPYDCRTAARALSGP